MAGNALKANKFTVKLSGVSFLCTLSAHFVNYAYIAPAPTKAPTRPGGQQQTGAPTAAAVTEAPTAATVAATKAPTVTIRQEESGAPTAAGSSAPTAALVGARKEARSVIKATFDGDLAAPS